MTRIVNFPIFWVVLGGVASAGGAARATVAGAGVTPGPAGAADAARTKAAPEITATGTCPAAETIWNAMMSLVPRGALDALPRSATIDVSDLGDSYRVRLVTNGTARDRVYRDLAHDCEQRARFAAVFVVLTLMPPELLIESPPKLPPEEPPVVVAPPPPVVPPPRWRVRVELAALGDTAPAVLSGPAITSAGGELRVALGRGRLMALAAIGLQPSSDFTVGGLRAREQRTPLDAGVRLRHAGAQVEIGGEAGVMAALFRAQGLSPVVTKEAMRVDLGLRAGVTLRLGGRDARIAPVAGLHGVYFPRPYDLATVPGGIAGRTPTFRIGGTVGVAASF